VDKLIIKLFGVNRMNFWGWVCAGLLVIGCCLFFFARAYAEFLKGGVSLTIVFLLAGIGVLLLGQFGLALQTYGSLLTEKLERQQARSLNLGLEDDLMIDPQNRRSTQPSGAEQRGIRQGGA
jgi:hypothetical protein